MGKLLKKKPLSKAKKKKGDQSQLEAAAGGGAQDNRKLSIVPLQQEAAKRPADTPKRTIGLLKPVSENTFIGKSLQFLREVKVELKKVTWPSRKQTIGSTVVVIILVIIISLFLGVVDIGLSGIIRMVLQR